MLKTSKSNCLGTDLVETNEHWRWSLKKMAAPPPLDDLFSEGWQSRHWLQTLKEVLNTNWQANRQSYRCVWSIMDITISVQISVHKTAQMWGAAEELKEDGLIFMALNGIVGTEFDMLDSVPLIPFQPLQSACPPLAPPTSLLWCGILEHSE